MKTAAVLLLALLLLGCSDAPKPADLGAEEARLRATDAAWLAAIQTKDVERTISYWADDARIYPPGQPPVVGKAAIRKYVAGSFATPGFSIRWKTEQFVLSAAGDMAYQLGSDHITFTTPDGKPGAIDARSTAVWRKQPDGTWKCVVDIWNE